MHQDSATTKLRFLNTTINALFGIENILDCFKTLLLCCRLIGFAFDSQTAQNAGSTIHLFLKLG